MIKLDSRGFRLGFATFVLFTGLAGEAWRNSISWYGFGAVVAIVVTLTAIVLVRNRHSVRWGSLPFPLLAFLGFATVSIAWSYYPGYTTLGAVLQTLNAAAAITLAVTLTWSEILLALGVAIRIILGLSFAFEFVVAAFVRHPIFPVWVVPDDPKHPAALLYWSRDLLFSSAKIQGIVGNSSLLAMVALIGVIVFALQVANRSVSRFWGLFWLLVALITVAITKSATIIVALVVVTVVAAVILLKRRARTAAKRRRTSIGLGIGVLGLVATALVLHAPLLNALGKNSTLTGRTHIWQAVIGLAEKRPAVGWGWLSYWVVWIEPFKNLVSAGGVQVAHAHNAWLDVWLQLGIVGLVLFIILVFSTLVRCWSIANDTIISGPRRAGYYSWVSLLPLLVLVAQLIQSIAESRILIEGGWMLLVLWAVKTKLDPVAQDESAALAAAAARPAGRLPRTTLPLAHPPAGT